MKKANRFVFAKFVVFTVGGLVPVILMVIFVSTQRCKGLNCLQAGKLSGFQLEDVYQNTRRMYYALLKQDDTLLRIETWSSIESHEAEQIINAQILQMHTLYEKAMNPYPGVITQSIVCDTKYQPEYAVEQVNGKQLHIFTGYASQRLGFGACTDDLLAYRAFVALLYCEKQKQLFKLEIFSPLNNSSDQFVSYQEDIRRISCRQ